MLALRDSWNLSERNHQNADVFINKDVHHKKKMFITVLIIHESNKTKNPGRNENKLLIERDYVNSDKVI